MMNDAHEYIVEMYNKEISKLRKEIYMSLKKCLMEDFNIEDVERAWSYFHAIPLMNSLNRCSYDILFECCNVSKEHKKSNSIL